MIKELPESARKCMLKNIFVTEDAKVFSKGKTGFKELSVREDKKGTRKFYYSGDRKYHSLVQAYAEAFVPNESNKPLAFIMDNDKGLNPDNILWATNDEWLEYWKAHTKRICKCCGSTMESDMVGKLCKKCFRSMSEVKPDTDEIVRFQERIAATGFNPDTDRFSGRQRDALELYCSGEPLAKIASVLGCDMATAAACIKSAKTARALEKITADHVTEIGYKSAVDVVPSDAEQLTGEQLETVSEEIEDIPVSVEPGITIEVGNLQESITDEETSREPLIHVSDRYDSDSQKPTSLATITVVMQDNNRVETGRDTIPVSEKNECISTVCRSSLPRVIGRLSDSPRGCVLDVKDWEAPVFDKGEPVSCEVAESKTDNSSIGMQVVPEDAFVEEPTRTEPVKTEQELGLAQLYARYERDISGVDFATYCKVYWLACKYTDKYARALATVTIRFMLKKNYTFNVSNINYMLRTGMEVIWMAKPMRQ